MAEERDPLHLIGVTVDSKYRIDAFAGDGGFSTVYKATHTVWNEPVAIKFFTLLESASEAVGEQLLKDFIQEGKLMSQLSSRSAAIVQARDIGKFAREDGSWLPYMVLEWLSGRPLDAVLLEERQRRAAPRAAEAIVQLLEPAADALDMAHQMGIAHRDLKPANLFLVAEPGGKVGMKVLDFGIAKVMSAHQELHEQLQLTTKQTTAFTPSYGAPEQFSRNYGATGPWTDVFAMGLIFVEMLRGAPTLTGKTYFELGVASCDEHARPTPRTLGVVVPDPVEAVFARALALRPSDRYARMGEFWDDLHAAMFPEGAPWRRGSGTVSEVSGNTSRPGVTAPPIVAGASLSPATAAPVVASAHKRSSTPLVVGAAALLLLGGAAAWMLGGRGPDADDSDVAVAGSAPPASAPPASAPPASAASASATPTSAPAATTTAVAAAAAASAL
ncbi:MAG TPA: serine/threonine protein kinase, partial [Sorangium sp.]|nr:serine/threonine protein kinase [Sorangium sp.]